MIPRRYGFDKLTMSVWFVNQNSVSPLILSLSKESGERFFVIIILPVPLFLEYFSQPIPSRLIVPGLFFAVRTAY
jgi:hypothetical protein